MLPFIKKQWFLFLLALALIVGYRWNTPANWVKQNIGVTILIVPQLFLMSFTLPTDDLIEGAKQFKPILIALIVGYVFMPLMSLTTGVLLFAPNDPMAFGLLVMIAGPTTLTSNIIWTRIARGNDALALTITIIMTFMCFILSPAIISILGPYLLKSDAGAQNVGASVQAAFDIVKMAKGLFLKVILPIIVGQIAAKLYRKDTLRFKPPVKIFCMALVLTVVWQAIGGASVKVSENLQNNASTSGAGLFDILGAMSVTMMIVCALSIHAVAVLIIWVVTKWVGTAPGNMKATMLAGSQKTLPVAILIIDELEKVESMRAMNISLAVIALVAFHAGQLIFDTIMIGIWDYREKKRGTAAAGEQAQAS